MPVTGLPAKLAVEFIGTFFLTYTFATYSSAGTVNGLATGAVLCVLTYWGRDISGAAFNPAVTMVQVLLGKLGTGEGSWLDTLKRDWKAMLMYWGVQFGSAILAAILGYWTRPDDNMVACIEPTNKNFNFAEAFLVEWIWTSLICYVTIVMNYTKEMEGNYSYGFAIGMTWLAASLTASISGGGYNPALSFGLWFSSTFNSPDSSSCAKDGWANMWYFLLAPIAGSFSAWGTYRITHEERFAAYHDLIMEFVGTFFLTFAMCCTILVFNVAYFQVGFLVAALVYVGYHRNSGHYNPIVSLAVFINGGMTLKKFGLFSAAQCSAAFLAAIVGYLCTRYDNDLTDLEPYHPKVATNANKFGALLAEYFFTCFVTMSYLVTMNQVHKTGLKNNPFYGVIAGFAVMAGYATVGQYTYSIFNPAIWLGSSLVYLFAEGGDDVGEIYIYAISGFGGCVSAAFFYKFFFGDPFEGEAYDSAEGQMERDREEMRRIAARRAAAPAPAAGGAGKAGAGSGAARSNNTSAVMTANPVAGTSPAAGGSDGKPSSAV